MEEERLPMYSFVRALLSSIATACISVYRCLLAPLPARVLPSNLFIINQTTVISSDSELLVKQQGRRDHKDVTLDAERREEELDGGEIINTLPSDDATATEGSKHDHLDSIGNIPSVIMAAAEAEEGGASASSHTEAAPILTVDMMWSPQEIPYHVLASATNNFSEEMMLGRGGFGPVYRGFLPDLAMDVAVKRLSERSHQGHSEYMAEIKIITQVRHRNLVKLIGWCHEHGELLLVYEFMPNGSLDDHLFKDMSNNLQQLDWPVRYKIAVGLANALTYLHDDCDPFVLHRDVKSSNVLLDSKFDAKLADFGLARRFSLDDSSVRVSRAAGTRGYWAPEYALMCRASRRSDVYSFGVVALEIACGKKAILVIEGESDARLLVEWVWELYGNGSILDAADKRLSTGQGFDRLQLERLLMVGLWCAQPDTRKRPTSMRQAGNALLFPETTPLPDLPRTAVIWAHPVASMRMQTVPLSSNIPESSPTLSSSAMSDDLINKSLIISSPGGGNYRLINTSPKSTAIHVIKPKRSWLFNNIPHFTRWTRRSRTRNGDVVLCDDDPELKKLFGMRDTQVISTVKSLLIDLATLRAATGNFSDQNKLGQGGFGPVYKGLLPNGHEIAVKKLNTYSRQREEELKNEVLLLSKLQHQNLVRLLGFCINGKERLLVYEYASNRSLDKLLFGTDSAASHRLTWERRYRIIGGIARGLQYLHEDSQAKIIIHRDLTASNVLLDADMNAKISGFRLARLFLAGDDDTHATTGIVGTIGYIAPEYFQTFHVSSKTDVFSFGVLVLEVVTGRRRIELDSIFVDLLTWVWEHWTSGTVLEIVDPTLKGQYQSSEVLRCVQMGLLCVEEAPAERPTMTSVVLMLSSYSVSLQVPRRPALVCTSPSNILEHPTVLPREADTRELMSRIFSPGDYNPLVVAVVGMGGVGKTTLVQHVYNDQAVSEHFELRGWVCVYPDDYEVVTLTKRIIEAITKERCDLNELSPIQEILVKLLSGKRFLLVLDDLWNPGTDLWFSLRAALLYGLQGSTIVTITRDENVARLTQTTPSIHVGQSDDCWAAIFDHSSPSKMSEALKSPYSLNDASITELDPR